MQLNGEARREFRDAILSAFPTHMALTMLVDLAFDVPLGHIVPTNTELRSQVYQLIKWAESHNKEQGLLRAALRENSRNRELIAFTQRYLPAAFESISEGDERADEAPGDHRPPAFSAELLNSIWTLAVDAGLSSPERRSLLLAWLPAALVAGMPRHGSPADQLRADLTFLATHPLDEGGLAIKIWLQNAARLIPYRAKDVKKLEDWARLAE